MIDLILDDCMNVMKKYEDNHFDLAIVDPPYEMEKKSKIGGFTKGRQLFQDKKIAKWDIAPKKEYFDELFRVSKNQIIWGGNYFINHLSNTRGIICWDKEQPFPKFSGWEMAFKSFNCVSKIYKFRNQNYKRRGGKIHPTQKPIELYGWLLKNYAKKGDKILDTHLGSGSIAVACYEMAYDFVGIEIDEEYYNKAKHRVEQLTKQKTLF